MNFLVEKCYIKYYRQTYVNHLGYCFSTSNTCTSADTWGICWTHRHLPLGSKTSKRMTSKQTYLYTDFQVIGFLLTLFQGSLHIYFKAPSNPWKGFTMTQRFYLSRTFYIWVDFSNIWSNFSSFCVHIFHSPASRPLLAASGFFKPMIFRTYFGTINSVSTL